MVRVRAARHWLRLRRAVQGGALLLFIGLWLGLRRGGWPAEAGIWLLRLDPLAMLAHLLASRTFLAGSSLALLVVALTLVTGRSWCGWLCPLGTVLDLFSLDRWRGRRSPPPESWRAAKYGLLLVILFAALFGNLTLLFLDPLTIIVRTLTVAVWPALDQVVTGVERALYPVPWLRPGVAAMDSWLRPELLPAQPIFYRTIFLYAGLFGLIILLNLLAARFWCRYLCPLGALLGLLSKVALLRREVAQTSCTGCSLCARACPAGTIQAGRGYASDPGECTLCLECLATCQRDGVQFPLRRPAPVWNGYDPNRRQALAALGVAAAGVGLLGSDMAAWRENQHLIRPPGARENNFLDKCLRCGICLRACPTGALQGAVTEAGLEGFWTPLLVPRLGYCDYACNACGQACPVEAISALSLPEKRQQVIGQAVIDRNRCIAWADRRDCIVCEEMCPVPEKAIRLEPAEVPDEQGQAVIVQQPYVIRERCIGCGICEYKCPVNGEAAIRVFVPEVDQIF